MIASEYINTVFATDGQYHFSLLFIPQGAFNGHTDDGYFYMYTKDSVTNIGKDLPVLFWELN